MSVEFSPPDVQPPETGPDDPRLGHLIGRSVSPDSRLVIIGFPSDEGVRLNGGRPGAAEAPREIRRRLYRLAPDPPADSSFRDFATSTVDLGDLVLGEVLEENQERLGDATAPFLAAGLVVVILGGGHETAFGHFLGHASAGRAVNVVNWDAHPDVRPLRGGRPHSGSPFRQALLHTSGACRSYAVAGLLRHQTSAQHVAFLAQQGSRVVWREDLDPDVARNLLQEVQGPTMVSFDMDAVDQAFAPGVSAPAAGGLDPLTWLRIAYESGRARHVSSMDVVELNPLYDRDAQTATLAALTVWHFMRGLAERGSERGVRS